MDAHGLEYVLKRNAFYEKSYQKVALATVFFSILLLALGGLVFYLKFTWPKPLYFATSPDGRPIPIIRLDQPIYQESEPVFQWATDAVKAIYALDFVTWRKTLQEASVYFTEDGYQNFLVALKASTNLESVKSNRQVVSIEITAPPTLNRKGQLSPTVPYSWDLQMPATVTYQNSAQNIMKQEGIVLMVIERGSFLRHPEGLAIQQLVFQAQ